MHKHIPVTTKSKTREVAIALQRISVGPLKLISTISTVGDQLTRVGVWGFEKLVKSLKMWVK